MKKQTKSMDRFVKHMADMVEKYGEATLKEIERKNKEAVAQQ
jgi:hypothetical protein